MHRLLFVYINVLFVCDNVCVYLANMPLHLDQFSVCLWGSVHEHAKHASAFWSILCVSLEKHECMCPGCIRILIHFLCVCEEVCIHLPGMPLHLVQFNFCLWSMHAFSMDAFVYDQFILFLEKTNVYICREGMLILIKWAGQILRRKELFAGGQGMGVLMEECVFTAPPLNGLLTVLLCPWIVSLRGSSLRSVCSQPHRWMDCSCTSFSVWCFICPSLDWAVCLRGYAVESTTSDTDPLCSVLFSRYFWWSSSFNCSAAQRISSVLA